MDKPSKSLAQASKRLYERLADEIKERANQTDSSNWGARAGAPEELVLNLGEWIAASAVTAGALVATGDIEQIDGWSWSG